MLRPPTLQCGSSLIQIRVGLSKAKHFKKYTQIFFSSFLARSTRCSRCTGTPPLPASRGLGWGSPELTFGCVQVWQGNKTRSFYFFFVFFAFFVFLVFFFLWIIISLLRVWRQTAQYPDGGCSQWMRMISGQIVSIDRVRERQTDGQGSKEFLCCLNIIVTGQCLASFAAFGA